MGKTPPDEVKPHVRDRDEGAQRFNELLRQYDRYPNARAAISRELWALNPKLWQFIQEARELKQRSKEKRIRELAREEQRTAELARRQGLLRDIQKARWNTVNDLPLKGAQPRYRPGITQQELIRRAAGVYRSSRVLRTVSAFSDWVYDVYPGRMRHPSSSARSQALEQGLAGEQAVELERKRRVMAWGPRGNWSLVSSAFAEERRVYEISQLEVDGATLRGSPDYLFRHDHTGAALIVEIKTSLKMPYVDAWPNARAQVWAYGLIDELKDAPDVSLVVETWTPGGGWCTGRFIWRMSDADFRANNRALFEVYRAARPRASAHDRA